MSQRLAGAIALLILGSCKGEEAKPQPVVDYAAKEAEALKRNREETARKLAEVGLGGTKPTATFEPPSAGAKACMKLAQETRECEALKPSEREKAPACRQVVPNEMKACMKFMASKGLDRNPF